MKMTAFVNTISAAINSSPMTQCKIAQQIGYEHSNMISMFKSGKTRVPMTQVVPLAEVLQLDPTTMLRMWFDEHEPGMWPVIEKSVWASSGRT